MLTALDMLYIILAIAIALLAIFGSVLLIYAILILRDVNKATDAVKDSAERMNNMLIKPLTMTRDILKLARPVIDVAEQKLKQHAESCKNKAAKKRRK